MQVQWQFCAQVSGKVCATFWERIYDQLGLYSFLVHYPPLAIQLILGFSSLSRSRCLEGGFSLWLGGEGIVNGKTSTIFYILTYAILS
jgi:hypothetical protein